VIAACGPHGRRPDTVTHPHLVEADTVSAASRGRRATFRWSDRQDHQNLGRRCSSFSGAGEAVTHSATADNPKSIKPSASTMIRVIACLQSGQRPSG
jgi:hypothetical protein